eukprot:366262-Chlamydomonas_euryale.AAC.9
MAWLGRQLGMVGAANGALGAKGGGSEGDEGRGWGTQWWQERGIMAWTNGVGGVADGGAGHAAPAVRSIR